MTEQLLTVTTCWSVQVGGDDLGAFISCDGLGMELVMEQREEGGNNGFVWQLPTRVKYSNIKLSRPICQDTDKVVNWINNIIQKTEPVGATIRALTAESKVVTTWTLQGVIPVRWTGPSLSADSPKAATETIELAHHGFTVGRA
ncbi:phage tail protein [Ornithinimicrobium sp. F0845]|uniref:phage tail protein n=1 Tax=Ornithinimicrobium sp. F0845 TaxID=2926412 RepID=UPI001FF24A8B|nr:phage tail protein [Ornithinimicrobium sp. F0845]MCK0113061.1 phage tail protein [Ornithinimicrobium sp. F0845]